MVGIYHSSQSIWSCSRGSNDSSIIDKVFNKLYQDKIYVGEIYAHLGCDKSKDSLHESAQELLNELMNN